MFHRSDVNSRVPRFKEIIASFNTAVQQGGLDGVPDHVFEQVAEARPVGLNRRGEIVFPRHYQAEDGPAVLVQLPAEVKTDYTLPVTRRLGRTVTSLLAKANAEGPVSQVMFNEEILRWGTSKAWVGAERLMVKPDVRNRKPFTLGIPRILCISQSVDAHLLGPAIAHEADHWDFFMNSLPALQDANHVQPYTGDHLTAVTEKRAYDVSYHIEQNLGRYAGLETIAAAERFQGIEPDKASEIADYAYVMRKRRGDEHVNFNIPFAAQVVTMLFGNEERLATDDEVTAMRSIGAI